MPTENKYLPKFEKSFSSRHRIQNILEREDGGKSLIGEQMTICGWSKSVRKQGGGAFCFVALNDGSTPHNIQVIVEKSIPGFDKLLTCGVSCSFKFFGEITESPAAGQAVEFSVRDPEKHSMHIYGTTVQAEYPLSKKQHGKEFLREICHLRPRSYFFGAVSRVRSQMCLAIHTFFTDRGFIYVHTPIITSADCEGAGETFTVTTLLNSDTKPADLKTTKKGEIDYSKDFFGKSASLTVSGQLCLEGFSNALSDVYTFCPAFRAENSHTSRHLAEFWMVEPEISFADIHDLMDNAEDLLHYTVRWALDRCRNDIEWFDKNVENGLIERLENIVEDKFARITYTEAIEILIKSGETFTELPEWGIDMGSEHERYLAEKVYKRPVIVYNYPKEFKAFYMRLNDDNKTVAAMDVLLPKIGEVMGGSQREERLEYLDKMIEEKKLDKKDYWWYRDFRRFGTVPHAGHGLGFERLIMLITGIDNIKDVIPYPRYPGHAEF